MKRRRQPAVVKKPQKITPPNARTPIKPPMAIPSIAPINTVQGVNRSAFLRGAARSAGMMKGDPKPKTGATGLFKYVKKATPKATGQIMKGQAAGTAFGKGNFTQRIGKRG